MMKKLFAFILALVTITALGVSVSAVTLTVETLDPAYNVVIINEDGSIAYDYDSTIPECEPVLEDQQSRATINVTASDVWKVQDINGGVYEYWAEGYVTAAEYHYARAEMWYQGAVYAEGFVAWGTGKVSSKSAICWGPNATPQIFYGS